MMEKLTKYVEDNYKDMIELKEVDDSIHIHMPLFGDYVDVPKNELDTQIIDKLANKVMIKLIEMFLKD